MKNRAFSFSSATGVCDISAEAYLPESDSFSSILVIHHGMAEHRQRYLPFIRFLTDHGIAVYMHDMASHGQSVSPSGMTGWFGEHDGVSNLVRDFRTLMSHARQDYPEKKIFVMGHSMGSFICRLYLSTFPEDRPAGAVIMGSGGPNPAAKAGLVVASAIAKVKGKTYKSQILNQMAFGSYGKRFEGRTEFDWLTRDTAIVDQYVADPLCGYLFTVQGMYDLVQANIRSNSPEWFASLPKDLPLLLISGEEDPVGEYGKGVQAVADQLRSSGHNAVSLKLYPGCRHEILNETNRQEIMEDLLRWLDTGSI